MCVWDSKLCITQLGTVAVRRVCSKLRLVGTHKIRADQLQ